MLNDSELLPGPSARSLLIAAYVAAVPAAAILLFAAINLLVSGMSFTFDAHPVIGYGSLTVFIVSVSVGTGCMQAWRVRLGRELANGYVTLPYDFRLVELRDPRTGQVLREKGTPGGKHMFSISLRRWRAANSSRSA
jgi:hypothetical protein